MTPPIHRIIISAPFGNYLRTPGVTSTIGTYTLKNRAGWLRWRLFWRIFRTLRWKSGLGAWTNKLGLPNPGIAHALRLGREKLQGRILSIHGFNDDEWSELLVAAKLAGCSGLSALEINISCPNVGHLSVPTWLFKRAQETGLSVIVKLPPVGYWDTFKLAYDAGIRYFHCCNTLPVPAGGMSGKPLMRVSLDVIKRIKDHKPDVKIIGGGGITSPADIETYFAVGAEHFAIGSLLLRPSYWLSIIRDSRLFEFCAKADELWMAEFNKHSETGHYTWVKRDLGAG